MKITIICSDINHPVFPYLENWKKENSVQHHIELLQSINHISSSEEQDILFLVSCSEIVKKSTRNLFRYTLVLHASDLPEGRGWSPHIWDIINGKNTLTLSLLNAEDSVDTGDIWKKIKINLTGNELFDEINHKLFTAEIKLISWACENIDSVKPKIQSNTEISSYHRKRTPRDSKLDENASIASQFNLLRVCDSTRFPAFFIINGQKYNIKIEKDNEK